MEEKDDIAIVFLPEGNGRTLDSFSTAVLLQYSDSDVLVFRYGKRDGTEEDIVSLFGNDGRTTVRSLSPEGRDFMFELNDVLSMPQKTLTVDITFASPFHAAQANYFGLNSRLTVYYSFRTEAGPDRKQMNPHMKNYGKLDGDSITLLTAMVNGCGTVMEMMYETGFSNKKVYRKVLDLYKKGYITCDDRSKTKVYSLTPDQEMMFINTSEMD